MTSVERQFLKELFSHLPWMPEWNNCTSGIFLWNQEPMSDTYFELAKKDIYLSLEKIYVLMECVHKNKENKRIQGWQSILNWKHRLEFYASLFQLDTLPKTFLANLDEKNNNQIKQFKVSTLEDAKSRAMNQVFEYWSG